MPERPRMPRRRRPPWAATTTASANTAASLGRTSSRWACRILAQRLGVPASGRRTRAGAGSPGTMPRGPKPGTACRAVGPASGPRAPRIHRGATPGTRTQRRGPSNQANRRATRARRSARPWRRSTHTSDRPRGRARVRGGPDTGASYRAPDRPPGTPGHLLVRKALPARGQPPRRALLVPGVLQPPECRPARHPVAPRQADGVPGLPRSGEGQWSAGRGGAVR